MPICCNTGVSGRLVPCFSDVTLGGQAILRMLLFSRIFYLKPSSGKVGCKLFRFFSTGSTFPFTSEAQEVFPSHLWKAGLESSLGDEQHWFCKSLDHVKHRKWKAGVNIKQNFGVQRPSAKCYVELVGLSCTIQTARRCQLGSRSTAVTLSDRIQCWI